MKIGFCVVNYPGKPLEKIVRPAVDDGYDCVKLPAYMGNGQIDVESILRSYKTGEVKKMVENYGMTIASLSNHMDSPLIMGPYGDGTVPGYKGTREEEIQFGTESIIRSAQLVAELGVPAVVASSGTENYGHISDQPEPNGWKYEGEQFAEKWGRVSDKYKEYGVKVAFEPHPNNVVYDMRSTLRLLEVVDHHPGSTINLNPADILFSGMNIQTFVDELRGGIVLIHAKDCEITYHNLAKGGLNMYTQSGWGRLDRSFRFRIPGWGDVDWKRLISELFIIEYDGAFSYEREDVIMSRADGVEKTIEFLRPLMIEAPCEGRNGVLLTK